MKTLSIAAVLLAGLLATPVLAQSMPAAGAGARSASALPYEGQVRRINRDGGRVTITHGPLAEFNMGPMTMAFAVKDPQQLAAIKEGDRVRFALQAQGENLVVTRIEPVK